MMFGCPAVIKSSSYSASDALGVRSSISFTGQNLKTRACCGSTVLQKMTVADTRKIYKANVLRK
jgi:hypothetical protein